MNYINLKRDGFILAAMLAVTACNTNETADTTSDTAVTYTTPNSNTAMAPDTGMTVTSGDTSTMADTSMKTTSGSTSTAKKKGKASVEAAPAAKNLKIAMDKSGVYNYSDVPPAYPGGQTAIEDYVNNNLEYPQLALDNSKEGRVVIAFVVNENGNVSDARTSGATLGNGLDEEAVRVISSMNKWTPGTVKGKPVKVRMTLPINFTIQE